MTEIIHTLAKVALVCGIIILGFWFFKHHTRATIDPNDKSMDATNFPEGGYSVNTSIESVSGLKSGDFVAFRAPADPGNLHIARVIGIEGNRVAVTAKGDVLVNGQPLAVHIQTALWSIPETKIPRGCAYVLADDTNNSIDSKQIGPVPFSSIAGTVKPSH